ncbi:hypothetical protein ACPESR_00680 [Nocardia testacea]|uniref:hypothetical protein n=1 Tax=Nocardia testacea TaxID=248551 RepID=UPI0002F6E36F|nr:hypothetical protein [Nocardia testacea]
MSVPGFGEMARSLGRVRDRLKEAGLQIGRTLSRHSEDHGTVARTGADTFDASQKKRLEVTDELAGKTQLRLADNSANERPHLMVSAGDSVFVGTVHYKIYDLPQSRALLERLTDWLAATEGKKRVVIVEGRVPPRASDARSAFESDRGEIGAIAFKAREKGVEPISMEEDLADQVRGLLAEHRPEDVFGYYVLRQMPQGLAAQERTGLDMTAHLNEALDMFAHILPPGADARQALTDLMARDYAHTGFSGVFRKTDEDWLMKETNDPGVTGIAETPVQKVALACNMRRDAHAAELIQQQVDSGTAVFAQFGIIHFDKVAPNVPAFADSAVTRLPAE